MANTSSAKKMVRKIARKTAINKNRRSRMRSQVREVELALEAGNAEGAKKAFAAAEPILMRTAGKGLITKKTAARKISRLAKRVKKLSGA